jgi:prevent-host-death family protein
VRQVSVRDANQNFSRLIAEVEAGETVLLTKRGRVVAQLRPQPADPMDDPEWREAYRALLASLRAAPRDGYRVGKISAQDKYGDDVA